MRKSKDYYRLLHVDPGAPVEIIRSSYRTLMQRLKRHPDLGGDHETAALINEAYAVLTDPDRRARYDRGRSRPAPEHGGDADSTAACSFCGTVIDGARTPEPDDSCVRCKTPLFPADRMWLDASGKRMLERMQRELPVTCYTTWPQHAGLPATMRDLSLNGMRIAADFDVSPGSFVKVDCAACQSLARVAYCTARGKRWLIGLEFVTLRFSRLRGSFISAEV